MLFVILNRTIRLLFKEDHFEIQVIGGKLLLYQLWPQREAHEEGYSSDNPVKDLKDNPDNPVKDNGR